MILLNIKKKLIFCADWNNLIEKRYKKIRTSGIFDSEFNPSNSVIGADIILEKAQSIVAGVVINSSTIIGMVVL